jgi:O-antigen ligase
VSPALDAPRLVGGVRHGDGPADSTTVGPRSGGGRTAPWSERHPFDAVAVLSALLLLVLLIPSPLIVRPLGAVGTPANTFCLGLLIWWGLAKVGAGHGVARGRQPLRVALFLVLVSLCVSLVGFAGRYTVPAEKTAAVRGLLGFAALAGVALFAADGITTMDRVLVLLRRLVAGVAVVAGLGIVEYTTGFNPAQAMVIPGLARNLELPDQGRLLFLRVQSTALHPIELGTLLGLTLPLAVQLAFTAPRGKRARAWIPVALIATVLPMTLSRTGVIVAFIGIATIAWRWSWQRKVGAVALLAAFVMVFRLVLPAMIDGLVTIFVTVNEDGSTTGRTGRYELAARYWLEHPWTGRGLSTLYPATGQVFDNQYLYAATETGVLGVVALFVLFATMVSMGAAVRRGSTDERTRAIAQSMIGAALAMAVAFATADMASFAMVMTVFFLLAGVNAAMWRLTPPDPASAS